MSLELPVKLSCSFMTPTNAPLIHTYIFLYCSCRVWHHQFQDFKLAKLNRSQKSFVSYYSILAANVNPMGFTLCEIIVKQPKDEEHEVRSNCI